MNEPTPEKISKLPKWAQDYISRLQKDRSDAEFTAKRAVGDVVAERADAAYLWDIDYEPALPLGEFGRIAWVPRDRDVNNVNHRISIRGLNEGIQVMAPTGNILVTPTAANVVVLHTYNMGGIAS